MYRWQTFYDGQAIHPRLSAPNLKTAAQTDAEEICKLCLFRELGGFALLLREENKSQCKRMHCFPEAYKVAGCSDGIKWGLPYSVSLWMAPRMEQHRGSSERLVGRCGPWESWLLAVVPCENHHLQGERGASEREGDKNAKWEPKRDMRKK